MPNPGGVIRVARMTPLAAAGIVRQSMHQGMLEAGYELQRKIQTLLSQPGKGRLYPKGTVIVQRGGNTLMWIDPARGRRSDHRASSPGDPPAVDTGRLRGSIRVVDMSGPARVHVRVGTNVKYAPMLEYGTRRMAARPFMQPALGMAKPAMRRAMVRSYYKLAAIRLGSG